jgi:hypothetical protein
MNPSVIFVREWEQQMSSSGCCGRLEGDTLDWGDERCFAERRRIMEKVGELYRAIRDRFGDAVELRVVDPRNAPALIPVLLGEFRRYGVPLREALGTLFGLTVKSVVLNGRLVSRRRLPHPLELLELIDAVMPAASNARPAGSSSDLPHGETLRVAGLEE